MAAAWLTDAMTVAGLACRSKHVPIRLLRVGAGSRETTAEQEEPAALLRPDSHLRRRAGLSLCLMEDMMASCGERSADHVDALSSVLTGAFALGEVVGPIAGTLLTSRVGFRWATTWLSLALLAYTAFLALVR